MTPEQKFKRLLSNRRLTADKQRAIAWAADKIAALTMTNQELERAVEYYKTENYELPDHYEEKIKELEESCQHWKEETKEHLLRATKAEENFQGLMSQQKALTDAKIDLENRNFVLETCIQSMALHIRALIRESGKGK